MLPLQAAIRTDAAPRDGRRAARRTLRLEVQALSAGDASGALIHDLSESGLRIETTAALRVGETLAVELPEAGAIDARIVWARGSFFGCEFGSPVPKAAVSAALLRSPIEVVPELPAVVIERKRAARDYDYPPAEPTNEVVLLVSLLLSLAMVILFLIALTV